MAAREPLNRYPPLWPTGIVSVKARFRSRSGATSRKGNAEGGNPGRPLRAGVAVSIGGVATLANGIHQSRRASPCRYCRQRPQSDGYWFRGSLHPLADGGLDLEAPAREDRFDSLPIYRVDLHELTPHPPTLGGLTRPHALKVGKDQVWLPGHWQA